MLNKQLAEQKTEEFTLIRGKPNPHGMTRMLFIPPGESLAEVERLRAEYSEEIGDDSG